MNGKIAGCVVFFNPAESVMANLMTYARTLDLLIIVDNSPVENTTLAEALNSSLGNVFYHWQGSNEGIAKALNAACKIAIGRGYEWLFTMDQDSSFDNNGLERMVSRMDEAMNIFPGIGLISAKHAIHEEVTLKAYTVERETALPAMKDYTEVRIAMTSGNLLNLKAYTTAGPFADKLFIDHVDHEYCLRLRKFNYRIIRDNTVILNHSLGSFEVRSLAGKKLRVTNHNYQRRYYMTRNGLYVAKHYFSVDRKICLDIYKNIFFFDIVKILIFEKQKLLKMKAVCMGIYHYLLNRYGKYELRN